MKYAVKVPFDGSMLYVMECDGETVMLCDTKEEAEQRAPIWGEYAVVVEYKEEEC
jgi:hypothetical protein